jgi:hypothetical protein
LSKGAVVGIAVGVFVAGVFVGVFCALAYMRLKTRENQERRDEVPLTPIAITSSSTEQPQLANPDAERRPWQNANEGLIDN